MPSFTAHESPDGLTARVSARAGRSLVRSFEVESDDPANTTGRDVIEALGSLFGIFIGVPHPDWVYATCEDIDPGVPDRDDPRLWRARVTYTEPVAVPGTLTGTTLPPPGPPPPPPPPPPPGTAPAPAARPPLVSVGYRKVEVYRTQDLDGKRLVNAAGDPLEDVPPQYRGLAAIQYTRWLDPGAWSVATGVLLVGKVNLFAWQGLAADTLMIDGIESQQKTERGWAFWEVKFTILHDPEKWIPTKLVNAGRRAYTRGLPREPKTLLPVLGTTGQVLLNSVGWQWREGVPPAGDGDPVPLEFRFHDRIDFAGL